LVDFGFRKPSIHSKGNTPARWVAFIDKPLNFQLKVLMSCYGKLLFANVCDIESGSNLLVDYGLKTSEGNNKLTRRGMVTRTSETVREATCTRLQKESKLVIVSETYIWRASLKRRSEAL